MTREEFDKLFDKLYLDRAVHCDTEEKANEFLALADSVGYKWVDGKSLIEENFWEEFKKETCYEIKKGGFMYGEVDFYKKNNYQIIEYQPPLKLKIGDRVRIKDTQILYINGKIGIIEKIDMLSGLPYSVKIDDGHYWLWALSENELEKVEETIDDIIEEIEYHQIAINVLLNRLKIKAKVK